MQFKCTVANTDKTAKLGLSILLDSKVVWDNPHVQDIEELSFEIPDDEARHNFTFRMYSKLPEHTKINEHGLIIEDACLAINNIHFDKIDCRWLLEKVAYYMHDTNGSAPMAKHLFFGTMGCNGDAVIEFNTPIYLWLLENL